MRQRWRRCSAVLVALAAVVLLGGCEARLGVDVVVDADGAGTFTISLAGDEALLAEASRAGADPLGDLAAAGEGLAADGWRTVDLTGADGTRTVTLTRGFDGPEEFAELAGQLAQGLSAPELEPLVDLRIDLTDEEVAVRGTAALQPTDAVTELGLQPAQAVAVLEEGDLVTYEVSVALPGAVHETTGAREAEAGPLRWTIQPGERVEVLAVGERPSAVWWLLALIGGSVGVAAIGLLWLGRSGARRARGGVPEPR